MRLALPLLSIVLLLCGYAAHAQSPPGINYQGVARNLDGKPLVLKDITIRINIVKDGESGPVEYSETHSLKTNSFGLFTLVIGTGDVVTGDFTFISWATGNKWLRVEMDPEGGNRFQIMGSQQFMSVPYAFYAKYTGNSLTPGQGISITNNVISNTGDADASATNELNSSLILGADNKLRLTDAGGTKEADLSQLAMYQALDHVLNLGNDAGAHPITNLGEPTVANDAATKGYVDSKIVPGDPSSVNEIQNLSLSGDNLSITNNPAATQIDLSGYRDNTDSQDLSSSATGINRTINITGGSSTTIDVADNDNSATNEIQNLSSSATGTNRTIGITGGTSTVIDVADSDNSVTNEIQNLGSTVAGTNRTINISGGTSTTIDVADNDNSASNEIQNLSLTTNTLNLSSGGGSVNLAPYLDNTDNQQLTLVTNTLSLTNDSSPIDLTPYLDDTDDQALTLSGTNLSLVDGGSVNLTPFLDNTDSQDLSLTGNSLSLTGDFTPVNLAPYLDNTDSQNLSVSVSGTDRTINISGGLGVTFNVADGDANQTNEVQSLSYTPATRNLSISMGNTVNIPETQNIAQVLTQSNDAGGQRITNLGVPTASSDAVTKQYVDNADAILNSRISANYAFKTGFAYNSLLTLGSDIAIPLSGEEFDDFGVVGPATFSAATAGTYIFVVDGSISGANVSLLYNGTKYPVAVSGGRTNTTFMFRLTAGQTVSLVLDGLGIATNLSGSFFGYKLL